MLTRNLFLLILAIVLFAVGLIVALAGANAGTPTEWMLGGLLAFAAAHLP